MKEPVVADTSCLISLERIDRLHVLSELFEPIFAPPAVQREFGVSFPSLKINNPVNRSLVTALQMIVDEGEAEVIALARELEQRAILDDRRARSVAANLGVRMIGTVGVLVLARKAAIIPAIRPVLDQLESSGFHLSTALRSEAQRLVGE